MYQPLAPPHLSLCIDIYIYVYHFYLYLISNKNNCFLLPPLSLHWYLSPDRPLGTNHQLFGGQYDAKICQRISLSLSLSLVFLHKIHSSKWWLLKVWKFLLQNIAAPFWRLSNLKLNFHVNIEPMQTVFNLLFSRKPASRIPYHQVYMFKICISQDFLLSIPNQKWVNNTIAFKNLCEQSGVIVFKCQSVLE